jgi:hypothetical protein
LKGSFKGDGHSGHAADLSLDYDATIVRLWSDAL